MKMYICATGFGLALMACGGRAGDTGDGSGGEGSEDGGSGGRGVGGTQSSEDGGSGGNLASGGLGGDVVGSGGQVNVAGEECEAKSSFACDDNNSSVTLICGDDGKWHVGDVCDSDSICDPRASSVTHGKCVKADEICAGRGAGERFCSEGLAIECAAESLVASEETCTSGCKEGVCGTFPDECSEKVIDCTGECTDPPTSVASCGSSGCGVVLEKPSGDQLVRAPGYEDACVDEFTECREKYWSILAPKDSWIRVTVAADWGVTPSGDDTCPEDAPSCLVTSSLAVLSPKTPDAQARNVLVEYVEADATCP